MASIENMETIGLEGGGVTDDPSCDTSEELASNVDSSKWKTIKAEVSLLLHFSVNKMLAACTIGPGTVVTCSKSGADFGLDLIWALVLGSCVAYVLQEGAARLSIVSGSGLGQAMRFHLGAEVGQIPIICAMVAIGVLIGNSAYEGNNFVGSNAALFSLGLPESTGFRVLASVGIGVAATCVLVFGEVDSTSRALGVVVVGMVCLFGASLFQVLSTCFCLLRPPPFLLLTPAILYQIGFTAKAFGEGLLPNFPPDGGGVTALSMVSTTALPFNCFLASAAAEGFTLQEMRRGIACSTILAGLLSFFVVVTGSGIESKDSFSVEDVTDELRKTEGEAAGVLFGVGLFAAAFSSALSCALGASITCQSLLAQNTSQSPKGDVSVQSPVNPISSQGADQESIIPSNAYLSDGSHKENKNHGEFGRWADDGLYFRSIIVAIAIVGMSVGSSGANTINVIITAQVVNGLLLPVVAVCLLVCMNDENLMRPQPITFLDNTCLVLTVAATFFLSAHTIVGTMVETESEVLIGSAVLMFVFMVPILMYVIQQVKRKDASYEDLVDS